MVKIYIRATLPDELMAEFTQAIRNLDIQFDPDREGRVHIESLAETDFPVERLEAIMKKIKPSFPHISVRGRDS